MVLIKGKQIKASIENYLSETYESSHSEVVCEKYALKNIGKLLGKWLCQSLYFNPLRANPIKSPNTLRESVGFFHIIFT